LTGQYGTVKFVSAAKRHSINVRRARHPIPLDELPGLRRNLRAPIRIPKSYVSRRCFGVLMLIFEEAAKTERVPFRYYAMAGRTDVRRPWHDRHWAGLRLLLIVGKP